MIRWMFRLACVSLVVLAGCGGGGGGGGGGQSGPALAEIARQCFVEGQAVSCTTSSQDVRTITPNVAVTFTEAINQGSVSRFVEVVVENVSDRTSIKNTVEGLEKDKLVEIKWSQDSTQLTVTVLQENPTRQLQNGKSYQVTATVAPTGCVQTLAGKQVCTGILGPFIFRVAL